MVINDRNQHGYYEKKKHLLDLMSYDIKRYMELLSIDDFAVLMTLIWLCEVKVFFKRNSSNDVFYGDEFGFFFKNCCLINCIC